ncbi:MHYT domain-containing protein [Paractinoplanes ferrugineus]|uniref:Membrane protein n=1 Tax=Paractinoplanes ferrugineus TaxID=113564 RepID=A0A919IW42_9ACTN|nr:MHYT domain-containing protein [Actinoplanes ferrugineus]GIE09530.1 membrane protein [Actinoplanes ferrugineus]
MTEVHHFTYGIFNPIAAYLLAFLGSFFGLLCTARARDARTRSRRTRWLGIAAFSIGGGAIWLMHFSAMLGFDVPASPVRFDIVMTLASLVFAVIAVGLGLLIVGHGARSLPRVIGAGVLTGGGVLTMHYTGMQGMHVAGHVHYNLTLVLASAIIAVVACTVALWFAISVRGWLPVSGAAAIMAIAVCGMHYTGMAAMSVSLDGAIATVHGFRPLAMIVPITVLTAATIVGVALSALQAMTEEEFTDGAGTPKRGMHAETTNPWSLKQASAAPAGRRPSPRPVPARSTTNL